MTAHPDLREIVLSGSWFQDLPVDAIDQLVNAASVRAMPVNSYLYEQGLPSREIFCLLSGRVRISISSPNGQEFSLIDREPGDWFGEPGLVGDEGRIIDARLIEPSEVLVIPRDVVLGIADAHPIMYRNLFHYAQGVLRGFHELMGGILFYPLRSRVAGRLLFMAQEHGREVEGGTLLDIKVSQAEFARLALGSRQLVNKIFRDWHERDLVVIRDDYLLICDMERLEQEIDPFE
jgi:CRP-like cAMP-binding protein